MGKELLNSFVEQGYLDASVTSTAYDPYYEPRWYDGYEPTASRVYGDVSNGWDSYDEGSYDDDRDWR